MLLSPGSKSVFSRLTFLLAAACLLEGLSLTMAIAAETTTIPGVPPRSAAISTPVPEQLNAVEQEALSERAEGDAGAPVTVVEYASLTCPHCAEFYNDVMPQIEDKYIKTGKLRFIYRDFPLNGPALKAAALARCLPPIRYFGFLHTLFKDQDSWGATADFEPELTRLAGLAGLPPDQAKECLNDQKLLDALAARRAQASKDDQVTATPTFIFNNGVDRIEGAGSFDEFSQHVDPLLAASSKK